MLNKIENFLFDKHFASEKRFIANFCKNPDTSKAELIYVTGGVSTGKTSILNIIKTELLINYTTTKINFIEAKAFVHELRQAEIANRVNDFKHSLSRYDIVIIDNFEYLNNRPIMRTIVCGLFEELVKADTKIIISSTDVVWLEKFVKYKPSFCIQVVNLDKNKVDLKKIIKLKSKHLGLRGIHYKPKTKDIREIEGYLNKISLLKHHAVMKCKYTITYLQEIAKVQV